MSNEPNAQPSPEPEAVETAAPDLMAAFEAERAKARDDLLRALAEVENTRRRAERQTQDAKTYAIDRFARDLLPVADTLSRALAAVSPQEREMADESTRTFLAGVELTERSLLDAFARHGLKRIGARGEVFDPNLHQAVVQTPSDLPSGAIIEVLQAGFALGERTLRPAMVQVSAGPAAKPSDPGAAGSGSVDLKV